MVYHPTKPIQMEIPEYTAVYSLLREPSQWSREVKVVHVEDPIYIKVTNGNL